MLSLSPPGSTEESHGSASERPAVPPGGTFAASTHGEAEVDRALAAGAVYVTLSPVWAPTSKPDDRRPTLGAQRFLAAAHGRPVLALGGVTPDRFAALMSAGAHGAAVLGPFRGEPGDVARAVAAYRAAVSGGFLSGSKTKSAS
jgi:thiamine-phosphate pyrophosphorylase